MQLQQRKEREQQEKEALKFELESNLKNFKKQEALALECNRNLQIQLDQVTQQLKEKEQLHRISKLKLSELRRNLKQGKLKPIERCSEESKSTDKQVNVPLNSK